MYAHFDCIAHVLWIIPFSVIHKSSSKEVHLISPNLYFAVYPPWRGIWTQLLHITLNQHYSHRLVYSIWPLPKFLRSRITLQGQKIVEIRHRNEFLAVYVPRKSLEAPNAAITKTLETSRTSTKVGIIAMVISEHLGMQLRKKVLRKSSIMIPFQQGQISFNR